MENRNIYIVRCGEVALKGLNKPYFERMLIERIRKVLKPYKETEVRREDGLIVVRTAPDLPKETVIREISKVFGVDSISPAVEIETDMEAIGRAAVAYMQQQIEERGIRTFKVEAKRADKSFPVKSPEIARRIGARILIECKVLKVDVHNPECKLYVHVRKDRSFIYERKVSALGGLPLGTNAKGLVLLSGGIDSPVAAFLMAKRGMYIEAVHFHSYPYTSERAWEKVKDLAQVLTDYCGNIKIHSVNLLPIQEQIAQHCPEEEMTILIRRFMMKIAQRIARETGSLMLITGENLGQVASQTAEALVVTDAAVQMPVMRPLIAMDKTEIIDLARKIGTYDISILPYEDCCTVFLPKHPKTKPKLSVILESESRLNVEELVESALKSVETTEIHPK
ncbi:MAG: tRNA uracil 4-sulfurtransferase ThiI [Bacillota bacterium]|nr:tRNA uracil 4-sulfurtransferase ThiI [Bacillota bacterium]NLM09137.1 tRNA 4-thiouridine(8) synthase ThiI [Clostridiales Family XIII bacterium]